jgi:hypothetical protein
MIFDFHRLPRQGVSRRTYDNLIRESHRQSPAAPQQITIQERFEKYHRVHPGVYELPVARARRLVADGRKKIGVGMLTENFRWND